MTSANSTFLTLSGCEISLFCEIQWTKGISFIGDGLNFSFMEPAPISLYMSNVETIPGMTIANSLGLVSGSTVRAKHLGKDIFAGFKNLVGGELKQYTELLNESRNEALQRMMMQASSMGANAIVNIRFATSNVAAGASELFCYGTAVVVQ